MKRNKKKKKNVHGVATAHFAHDDWIEQKMNETWWGCSFNYT